MTLSEEFRSCWLIATIGCILFIVGAGILILNEGRAVHMKLSLDEALNDAVVLNPDEEMENNFEGRLVHISGPILIAEALTEPDYNIQVLAVKLKRRVQMYQWVEETIERSYGESIAAFEADDRTYYYNTEWRNEIVDSRRFFMRPGHNNPDKFPIESQIQTAPAVSIGKFELGPHVKERFQSFVEITSDSRPEDPSVKLHLGIYYHCTDVFSPEVGDIRVQFAYAGLEGDLYTVIGKLDKGVIVPYETSRKSKILLVYPGELTLDQAFRSEHHAQRLKTWTLRFIGWLMLFFATACTVSLLHIILTKVCFLWFMVPDLQYPVPANLMISFSLALLITSIAWIYHRPWIAAGLVFAAVSPFFYCARTAIQYQRLE